MDTADMYGDGRGEEFVGNFVRRRRDQVVLATKFAFVLKEGTQYDYSISNRPDYIRFAIDASQAKHQRNDLCADGDAIAEVATIGDDMDLRHRHRHASGKARDDENAMQHIRLEAEFAARRFGRSLRLREGGNLEAPPQQKTNRHHHQRDEQPDADMGGAPALCRLEMLDDQRPHRAGKIAARSSEADGERTPLAEPVGKVGNQRQEAGCGAKVDHCGIAANCQMLLVKTTAT